MEEGQTGIFLGTAHPAKFRETVENVLGQPISLPTASWLTVQVKRDCQLS